MELVPTEIVESDRPTVSCGIRVNTIRDINHLTSSFYAKIVVMFIWTDLKNIGKSKGTRIETPDEGSNSDGAWFPIPRFENAEGEVLYSKDAANKPVVEDSETGHTKFVMHVAGKFVNVMDLRKFPFDVQHLEIRIRFPFGKDRCRIESLPMAISSDKSVILEDSVMLLDWDICEGRVKTEYPKTEKGGKSHPAKPQFRILLPVKRAWVHHLLHIVLVLAGLTTCNFLAFFLPYDDLGGRTQIILTLLLTVIATKFLVKAELPDVPFVTPLDEYSYGAIFFFIFALVENGFITIINDGHYAHRVDAIFSYIWIVLWFSFNFCWGIRGHLHITRNNDSLPPVEVAAGIRNH